jgi:DNA modification methylase
VSVRVIEGDCRDVLPTLPADSVHCVVTSPPYWGLRDYGIGADAFGLEPTLDLYVQHSVEIFRALRRVLRDDGTLWLNLGDSYASSPPGNKTLGVSGKSTLNGVKSQTYRETLASSVQTKRSTLGGGLKPKDLCMVPARVALALQADGWWLRSEIVWAKPNPMPESVTDRPTSAHEKIYLLTKSERYWYDADAVKEPMKDVSLQRLSQPNVFEQQGGPKDPLNGNRSHRKAINNQAERLVRHEKWKTRFEGWEEFDKSLGRNLRNVWTIATSPFPEAHFATFPPELAERCIKAGCPKDGVVLDPFGGAGTTGLVADRLQRDAILIEASAEYCEMARRRIAGDAPLLTHDVMTADLSIR